MRLLPQTPSTFAWAVLLGAGMATAGAGALLGFSVPVQEIRVTVVLVAGLLAVAAWSEVVWNSPAIAEPCALFAFWVAMLAILLPASYFAAAYNLPLVDAEFSRWDYAVGFDWRWFQGLFARHVWAARISARIYQYAVLQALLAVICLAANREMVRLNTYLSSLLIATIITIVLSALLPATGAYTYYGLTDADKGHLLDFVMVPSYIADFTAVRAGTLRHLGLDLDGIIQFPSYHTIIALSAAWATWKVRWIGPLNAAVTAAVVVTTLPIGGHHLIDLAGGAVVFAGSLVFVTAVERPSAPTRVALVDVAEQPDFVWTRARPVWRMLR